MTGDPYLDGNFPESFVLGKLDEKERLDFEAHLLDCERCFSEVQAAARYVTAVKTLADHPLLRDARRDADAAARRIWFAKPLALAAAAAAALVIGLGAWWWFFPTEKRLAGRQLAALTQLCAAGDCAYVPLDPAGAVMRGSPISADLPVVTTDTRDRVGILFHGPAGVSFRGQRADVLSRSGDSVARRLRVLESEPGAEPRYGVLWDTAGQAPGVYRMVFYSAEGEEVGSACFRLER